MRMEQMYQGPGHDSSQITSKWVHRVEWTSERLERQRGDSIFRLKSRIKLGKDNMVSQEALVGS